MKSNRARGERKGSNDYGDTAESRHAWAANVYAIVGPDGAGKTTIARAIMDRLARRGVKTWIAWMRSPRIVTLGVLGITRLSKLSRTVRMGDHDDVITDLSHHPFLGASSSPRPARNSFDESPFSRWTRGSHAGFASIRGLRTGSDSDKSTAGPRPSRRVLLMWRNTSASGPSEPRR